MGSGYKTRQEPSKIEMSKKFELGTLEIVNEKQVRPFAGNSITLDVSDKKRITSFTSAKKVHHGMGLMEAPKKFDLSSSGVKLRNTSVNSGKGIEGKSSFTLAAKTMLGGNDIGDRFKKKTDFNSVT